MRKYAKVSVSEKQLEDLVRQHSGLVEDGLKYVTHQRLAAGGRLDVLMVDSG
jgi:RecB family endonuclease NucS